MPSLESQRAAVRRRRLGAGAALAAVLIAVLVLLARGGADEGGARAIAAAYAAAWSRGDDAGAARVTDDQAAAAAALRASRSGLDGAGVAARVVEVRLGDDALGDLSGDGDARTSLEAAVQSDGAARLAVRWDVPGYGPWSYTVAVPLVDTDGAWKVGWQPENVSPALAARTRLGTVTTRPDRAPILDRDGRGLVTNRPVVDVAVQTDDVEDPAATARALAAAIDDVDAGSLTRTLRVAPAGRFVPVITLRQKAFDRVADTLDGIPGVSTDAGTRPLAPSRDFGRALLGTVGAATAEQVERSRGRLAAGDDTGQSGLQAAYDARLAGRPSVRIVVRDAESGAVRRTLERSAGQRPVPLRTTLDLDVQRAGENALADVDGNAALVAVQPSTGDILAVVNRPGDATFDRALTGRYAPGSTFKVVTTAALLAGGLTTTETVDCPRTITVDGRAFRNFEGGAAGAVPFATDFAQSCNTAFISLADRLGAGALTRTALAFGLGRSPKLGVPVADASVPRPAAPVNQAAMMIGQDRIVASPLNMAGVAATVADGQWRAPRILADDPRDEGQPLAETTVATLRTLMRSVVTSGTGTALASVTDEPAGKSGTAEYGTGDPPPTRAWFIAYRDDVAVSVLVEEGASGGEVAAPLVADFLTRLD